MCHGKLCFQELRTPLTQLCKESASEHRFAVCILARLPVQTRNYKTSHCATSKSSLWYIGYVPRGGAFECPRIYRLTLYSACTCTCLHKANSETCDGVGVVVPGLLCDVEHTWNHALHPSRQATACRDTKQSLSHITEQMLIHVYTCTRDGLHIHTHAHAHVHVTQYSSTEYIGIAMCGQAL